MYSCISIETAYTSAATQRRDAQVLGIMRRVRSKLEGRDFGVQHKMSVHEQVRNRVISTKGTIQVLTFLVCIDCQNNRAIIVSG